MRSRPFGISQIAGVVLMTLLIVSCDAGSFVEPDFRDDYTPEPTAVSLDSLLAAITEEDTVMLRATLLDQEGKAIDGSITWSTSDDRIADVSSSGATEGTLVAKQPGTATITATHEDLTASATIEVHNRPVDLVYVSGNGQAGLGGEMLADSLVVRAVDKRGDPVSGIALDFTVVAGGGTTSPVNTRTDVNGFARAAWTLGTPGEQTVRARASEGQARVKQMKDSVVVFTARVDAVLTKLEVSPASVAVEEGDTVRLGASAATSTGEAVANPQVTWVSTDTSVATVSSAGLVRARKAGSARAIARTSTAAGTIADSAVISVSESVASVTGIDIRPAAATVDTGATQQFDAIALMSDGSEKMANVTWTATGGSITSDGLFSAGSAAGTFQAIAAHAQGYADTAVVTVVVPTVPVAVVRISPPVDTIGSAGTAQLTATLLDANGNELTGRAIAWSSSDTSVAAVSGTGLVTGSGTGQATITATSEGVSGTAAIVVQEAAPGAVEMSLPGDTLYGVGDTLTVKAVAHNADGSINPDAVIEWSSSDPTIAEVDNMGKITARALGTVIISASAVGCIADSGSFTVVELQAASVEVSPATVTIEPGTAQQFTASATMNDGSRQTAVVQWSASAGTVTTDGLFTAPSTTGAVQVVATAASGVADTAQVSVQQVQQQTPGSLSVQLTLQRLDGGSGSALVSSGILLPPGALTAAAGTDVSSQVRLLINGQAQPVYAEALYGFHPDGSRRSVLVQSTQSLSSGSPVSAVLELGPNDRTQAKTAVTWQVPQAVALPSSVDYLLATWPLEPMISKAEATSVPLFAQYEATFEQWSDFWANDTNNYYDRVIALYAYWARTGSVTHFRRAVNLASAYHSAYWTGTPQPRLVQPDGMFLHYLLVGNPATRARMRAIAGDLNYWYGPRRPGLGVVGSDSDGFEFEGRVQHRTHSALLYTWLLEFTDNIDVCCGGSSAPAGTLVDEMIDLWITRQRADGSFYYQVNSSSNPGAYGQSNFMEGGRMTAMIRYYYLKNPAQKVADMVKAQVDFLKDTQWVPDWNAFRYWSVVDDGSAEPESTMILNGLILHGFGFVYAQTGNTTYRTYGDAMLQQLMDISGRHFQYGGGNQFNQFSATSWSYAADRAR